MIDLLHWIAPLQFMPAGLAYTGVPGFQFLLYFLHGQRIQIKFSLRLICIRLVYTYRATD